MIDTKEIRLYASFCNRAMVYSLCDELDTLRATVSRLEAELAEAKGSKEKLQREVERRLEEMLVDEGGNADLLTDGFGNYWPRVCPNCGAPMVVVRPGNARCSAECYRSLIFGVEPLTKEEQEAHDDTADA